jgi:Zn-dependent protease with chaperone function
MQHSAELRLVAWSCSQHFKWLQLLPALWSLGTKNPPERQARADVVLERLLAAGALRSLPYHVVILEHDVPNALAFPGGTIAVTRGLLEEVESDRGLAAELERAGGPAQ